MANWFANATPEAESRANLAGIGFAGQRKLHIASFLALSNLVWDLIDSVTWCMSTYKDRIGFVWMAQKHKTPQLRCINLSNRQTHWTCVAHSGPLQPNILVLFSPPNFTSVICGLWVPYGAHCIPVLVLWESRSALLYILYIYISMFFRKCVPLHTCHYWSL